MIEAVVINYLKDKFPDIPVKAEKPEEMPERLIIVEKTAGGMSNQIKRATIAIESYGPRMADAMALNDAVITAMEGIVALDVIGGCRLNTDYNNTDLAMRRYRYLAVFNLTYYKEV